MKAPVEFPGYQDKKKKDEQKTEKRKMRQEKRKNALPPFLMVRGGLFDEASVVALIMIPLAEFTVGKYKNQNDFAALLYICLYAVPVIFLVFKWIIMNHEKSIIKQDLDS